MHSVKDLQSTSQTLAICVIDIDNFKTINDLYGHMTGDQVLKQVAGTIQTTLRPQDVLVRIGGDEFVIIISDYGTVCDLSDRMRVTVENLYAFRGILPNDALSISIGVRD